MNSRKLAIIVYLLYMLMTGILIMEMAVLGHQIITSSTLKVLVFFIVFVFFGWRLLLRSNIVLDRSTAVLLFYVCYTLMLSIINPEYNIPNLGYFSCLLLMLFFALLKSDSIFVLGEKKSGGWERLIVLIFTFIAVISIIEQLYNQPLLSSVLGVPPTAGVHYIGNDESFYVFYGWHNEVIPIINSSLGVFFRSVAIFPNGLDLGLIALFFFCFFVNKLKQPKVHNRKLYLVGLVSSIIVVFGVHTRVIWVALAFVIYYYVVIALRLKRKYLHVLLFLGIILQVAFTVSATIYSLYASSEDNVDSVLARVNSWLTAYQLISENSLSFIFGTGVVEVPQNGLLLDNTFISLFLYCGSLGLLLMLAYYFIAYVKVSSVLIKMRDSISAGNVYVCPIVFTGAPILYVLPILWAFNNYQQKLIVFFVFPILIMSGWHMRFTDVKSQTNS